MHNAPSCTALLSSFIADNEVCKQDVARKNILRPGMAGERGRRLFCSTAVKVQQGEGMETRIILFCREGLGEESAPVDGGTVKGGKIAILWRAHEGGCEARKIWDHRAQVLL